MRRMSAQDLAFQLSGRDSRAFARSAVRGEVQCLAGEWGSGLA